MDQPEALFPAAQPHGPAAAPVPSPAGPRRTSEAKRSSSCSSAVAR